MTGFDISPTDLPAWKRLEDLSNTAQALWLPHLFEQNPRRAQQMSIQLNGLLLDYSKNLVDETVLATLISLAEESSLDNYRRALFAGEVVNTTEAQPACHPLLRASSVAGTDGRASDVIRDNLQSRQQMCAISEKIRAGKWLGCTGKPIRCIVHIGIGGSTLGPQLCCEALRGFIDPQLQFFFIANVDGAEILSLLKTINPEETLIVVASKTFTTQETLLNARSAISWFQSQLGVAQPESTPHFIAITANAENARHFGIAPERTLSFDQSIGGRYSLWSSIGLTVAIAIGYENFEQLLNGGHAADEHFLSAPYERNIPVILALLGIWYNNFLAMNTHAVIPYCQRLSSLPDYLQQLDMESNGKSVSKAGNQVSYPTGPILWGQTGTNGQHAFFQLLHQGTHLVPVDFIGAVNDPLSNRDHHDVLLNNMLAQAAALMTGRHEQELPSYRQYPGNRPSNTLLMDELTPFSLGQLIAIYEHKVFVQGSIWNINSFDQWGVEFGKEMANALQQTGRVERSIDGSTKLLTDYIAALADHGDRDDVGTDS